MKGDSDMAKKNGNNKLSNLDKKIKINPLLSDAGAQFVPIHLAKFIPTLGVPVNNNIEMKKIIVDKTEKRG